MREYFGYSANFKDLRLTFRRLSGSLPFRGVCPIWLTA
jgi:hypothetical protein